jgi:protein-L-isoaspartate(D-aspartate) O-methyltransferase
LNSSFEDYAYQDKAFPIGAGQTISQPYTVAFQSQLLEVKKEHKVLEIGTGSGYQTAVLCLLGAKVLVLRQKELFNKLNTISKIEYSSQTSSLGWLQGLTKLCPFDSIIVRAPFIPQPLMAQLGGRLVIPLGEDVQIMTLLIRKNETQFENMSLVNFDFLIRG